MDSHPQVLKLVFDCVHRLNEQLPAEMRLEAASSTQIVGEGSPLESLSLVSLLVDIEESLARELSWTINLLDDGLAGGSGAQFKTLGEMADWIVRARAGKS